MTKIKDLKNMDKKPDYVTLVIIDGVYDIYQSYYWDETENDYVLNDGDIDELRIKEYSHLFRDFDEEKEILPIYVDYTRVKVRKTNEEKEIERLNKELEFEKSKNKEVREYIENYNIGMPYDHFVKKENLLEILDKENKE